MSVLSVSVCVSSLLSLSLSLSLTPSVVLGDGLVTSTTYDTESSFSLSLNGSTAFLLFLGVDDGVTFLLLLALGVDGVLFLLRLRNTNNNNERERERERDTHTAIETTCS